MDGSGAVKSSSGKISFFFVPDLFKTFNRGYTDYFLNERKIDSASIYTQKSTGEPMGIVKFIGNDYFIMDYENRNNDNLLSNGDGICFFDKDWKLCGMNIDRVEGEKIFPHDIRWINPGLYIYRNYNHKFMKMLKGSAAERKILIDMEFTEALNGFNLGITDEDEIKIKYNMAYEKIPAKNSEQTLKTIQKQLLKLGNTIYVCRNLVINLPVNYFLPVGILNEIRRIAIQKLDFERAKQFFRESIKIEKNNFPYTEKHIDYSGNVLNRAAEAFYRRHGVEKTEPAAESGINMIGKRVMVTKYCIKFQLGLCANKPVKKDDLTKEKPILLKTIKEPLFLSNGRHSFRLVFNCNQCNMEIYF